MIPFEAYHPMMTEHVQLNWLTAYPLKDIYALRSNTEIAQQNDREPDHDMKETAYYINHTMQTIMANQALTWGFSQRTTHQFIGLIELADFMAERTQATLHYEMSLDRQNTEELNELFQYVVAFAQRELNLKQLSITLSADDHLAASILATLGFKQLAVTNDNVQLQWQQ
ncbi:GNAT family N-acetyltransferase [Lactobacillus selangorensis]|nr:GNAT family N-acetyltransferase [Lactobacillus selangorensis]